MLGHTRARLVQGLHQDNPKTTRLSFWKGHKKHEHKLHAPSYRHTPHAAAARPCPAHLDVSCVSIRGHPALRCR